MREKIKLLIFLFLAGASDTSQAQVTITGPTCVVPGTCYHYWIKGGWQARSTMQACVTGGRIADTSATPHTCTAAAGAPLGAILVIWDSSNASIAVTSAAGNATLAISVTTPLMAGSIDSGSKQQMIGYDSIPATIICSVDSGGNCSPAYTDQWQQSADQVSWQDIPGSTGKNLRVTTALTQTVFYRRKVTETGSGTIAYSDTASVFVGVTAANP